jgi:protein-tyrosine phosphatase
MSQPGELVIATCPRPSTLDAWLGSMRARYRLLVSLLAERDVHTLGLAEEHLRFEALGGCFVAYPIDDFSVPDDLKSFADLVARIHATLVMGRGVAVHCRGGIGRSGMVVSAVLIREGLSLERSLEVVSLARGHPVPETTAQRHWLEAFADVTLAAKSAR